MNGFWARAGAVSIKELVQMRRDRATFGMMLFIPIMQLVLFGYAINMDPKNLPAAVHVEERTPIVRAMLSALENSGYYDLTVETNDPRESAQLLARGEVAFVISFPAGFSERLIRGDRPQLLIEADASDPSAASNALGQARAILESALRTELRGPLAHLRSTPAPFELVIHPRYNPEQITQYNIVPGLLGVVLSMTLVMITAIAMTREAETGTMENLLAMPARPIEVMVGKIAPYVGVGAVQTLVVLVAAQLLFDVPFAGAAWVLALGVVIFVIANLAVGFTFSTLAQSQLQAMQMSMFFFLPSLLLSGFMFPFRGMPVWAQGIGEVLPLTHFLRVIRGVMLKDASFIDLSLDFAAMSAFAVGAALLALARYQRTLD